MYDTAAALRQAIEARLNQRAREDGVEVNRLRRGFVFERIMARLEAADLVDLMLLIELDLVRPAQVLPVVRHVFESRGTHDVPAELPDPPAGWTEDYAHAAETTSLRVRRLQEAMSRLRSFWREALSLSLQGPG